MGPPGWGELLLLLLLLLCHRRARGVIVVDVDMDVDVVETMARGVVPKRLEAWRRIVCRSGFILFAFEGETAKMELQKRNLV